MFYLECVCVCVCVLSEHTGAARLALALMKALLDSTIPGGKNALNVSAIIPLITAACSRAKPGPDRDKELQVTQSIWGLLISVTCLSGRLEEKQWRLLTHTQGPAIVSTLCESASLRQSSRKCVYRLEERVLQTPLETHFRQA